MTGYTTRTRRKAPVIIPALLIAGALSGGGMWTIAQALASTTGYGLLPLGALPFGIISFGVGNGLCYAAARSMYRRDITRTYHQETR